MFFVRGRVPDAHIFLHSLDFAEAGEFALTDLQKGPMGWLEYVKGVAFALGEAGYPLHG